MEYGMVIKFMGDVDRTLLIKEFLDRRPLVSLFVSPNNLAKTKNMSMLKLFFEISDKDTSIYFKDKKIHFTGGEIYFFTARHNYATIMTQKARCLTCQQLYQLEI